MDLQQRHRHIIEKRVSNNFYIELGSQALRTQIPVSEEFKSYQKFIVAHDNYKTLPNKVSDSGEITWVKVADKNRADWWDNLKSKLGLPDRASVARAIHPKELSGLRPCQPCGRSMSIFAVYPDARMVSKLKVAFPSLEIEHFEQDIYEICQDLWIYEGEPGLTSLQKLFGLSEATNSHEDLAAMLVANGKSLSPGVMSNAPDRLDGFHSFNACCRSSVDKGRHKGNMARYSSDRRAFENWAGGDWVGADRLMGKFKSSNKSVPCPECGLVAKMTADHIGPISLGFMHRMEFQPMCTSCNSTKNNRFTLADVAKLIKAEDGGAQVISWHSKYLWDSLKHRVVDESSANMARLLLRKNLHNVLSLLSLIGDSGYRNFLLRYLHPEYADFDYEFLYFDPATGGFEALKKPLDNSYSKTKAERYLRVSFEALDEYRDKTNRKSKLWDDSQCQLISRQILEQLELGNWQQAAMLVESFSRRLSELSVSEFEESRRTPSL